MNKASHDLSLFMSRFALLVTLFLAPVLCAAPAELVREIKPLSVRGVNYFPRDTPWGKIWTETPSEVWKQEMAAAAKLGVTEYFRVIVTGLMATF